MATGDSKPLRASGASREPAGYRCPCGDTEAFGLGPFPNDRCHNCGGPAAIPLAESEPYNGPPLLESILAAGNPSEMSTVVARLSPGMSEPGRLLLIWGYTMDDVDRLDPTLGVAVYEQVTDTAGALIQRGIPLDAQYPNLENDIGRTLQFLSSEPRLKAHDAS